ncbi:hypothetical protein [Bradyrhizobium cosmicum]|uniref:hypothetical protein n=1 Tax=Bradyrhizobium cosmicum TaxID=1404864 RepID=UPI0028EF2359|nr:hypothetical protein [Bradyrhizobium cosmicum]
MRTLGNCAAPISREHIISESVIEILSAGGEFTVGGLPWLQAGETKALAPGNLTAKCLCRGHNSAIHPLDDCAKLFFSALKRCLERNEPEQPVLLSGHDLERWLLKTLKAMAASGNLASGRVKLPDLFQRDVDVVKMIDDQSTWPEATGLYFVMRPGSRFINNTRIQIQPWYGDSDQEIVGLWTSFLGLEFVLMIAAPVVSKSPILGEWLYRPGRIGVTTGGIRNLIELSWADQRKHLSINASFDRSLVR